MRPGPLAGPGTTLAPSAEHMPTAPKTLDEARVPGPSAAARLREEIEQSVVKARLSAVGVSVYDTGTGFCFEYDADRWFHAASTIKVAILVGVYAAIHRGAILPQSRVQVRNRFRSALDGAPFRVAPDRDANASVHAAIGSTMRVSELSRHMIVTSSNLATNLLLELFGLERIQKTLEHFQIDGVDVRRGVEDERAFQGGVSNRVTANGLMRIFRLLAEKRAFSDTEAEAMLEILSDQEFREGIPAGLPKGARVAHKTGDISTASHDAGIVYLPDREPYVVAILTEWDEDSGGGRSGTIAGISRAVYEAVTAGSA
jgi:beta-lactamase class A